MPEAMLASEVFRGALMVPCPDVPEGHAASGRGPCLEGADHMTPGVHLLGPHCAPVPVLGRRAGLRVPPPPAGGALAQSRRLGHTWGQRGSPGSTTDARVHQLAMPSREWRRGRGGGQGCPANPHTACRPSSLDCGPKCGHRCQAEAPRRRAGAQITLGA